MGYLEDAYRIVAQMFEDDPEPMPPWSSGDREKLEMVCHCTEVEAFGTQKYPTFAAKKVFHKEGYVPLISNLSSMWSTIGGRGGAVQVRNR